MPKLVRFEDTNEGLAFVARHIGIIDDPGLLVLKSHLLIELFLNSFIEKSLPYPQAVFEARLSFWQTLHLVKALHPKNDYEWLWDLIARLNRLRNELAHNIEPENFDTKIQDFLKIAGKHIYAKDNEGVEKLRMTFVILCGVVFNLEKT
jgi:hypothetical protein